MHLDSSGWESLWTSWQRLGCQVGRRSHIKSMARTCRPSLLAAFAQRPPSKIRQGEEQSYVTSFLDPDAVGVQDSAGDGGHLQSFRPGAGPLRFGQKLKGPKLAELANSRQVVLRTRRKRFVGPRPAERAFRPGNRPDDADVGHDFIAFTSEHQFCVIKAPLIWMPFETEALNPGAVARLHEADGLLAPSRPIGRRLRRFAHDPRPSFRKASRLDAVEQTESGNAIRSCRRMASRRS